VRYHHHAYRIEQTYCQWILRYIYHFGGKTHPKLLGTKDIERFLSHLAAEGKVSASTQFIDGATKHLDTIRAGSSNSFSTGIHSPLIRFSVRVFIFESPEQIPPPPPQHKLRSRLLKISIGV
jgi:hypothetical protein